MSIEKVPFRNYTLDEDKKKEASEKFSIRLNAQERLMLDKIKEYLNIAEDSTALKISAEIGLNVLHSTFGEPILKWLFKKDRIKLQDYKDF